MGSHLSWYLHKLGANLYCKLLVAPFSCKKVWYWMDGWVEAKAGLRIAYSNQQKGQKWTNKKMLFAQKENFNWDQFYKEI